MEMDASACTSGCTRMGAVRQPVHSAAALVRDPGREVTRQAVPVAT